jgi:hypothetical protein
VRTIGTRYEGPLYNWTDFCDYCGTPWHRSQLTLDADGFLRCPQESGLTLTELQQIAVDNVGIIDPVKPKTREEP